MCAQRGPRIDAVLDLFRPHIEHVHHSAPLAYACRMRYLAQRMFKLLLRPNSISR